MVYWQVIVLNKRTFFAWIFGAFLCITPIYAENTPQISAECAVLYDGLTGQILYGKQEDQVMGMASTTKIMTALVALEQYDPGNVVTVKREWTGIEGSSMYLKPGERLSVSDLLYGLLLSSGNDAAVALGGMHPAGAVGFVDLMNGKAEELGLLHTHFDNPSGLDGETHHTTALELAILTAHAMQNELFAQIVSTKSIQVAGRWLSNHNRLLSEIDACGVKTGFTKSCGRCLVSAKEQNGRMLICVTLRAPDDWNDHKKLYDYGFSQYDWVDIVDAGECGLVPMVSADRKAIKLYISEPYRLWMTKQEENQLSVSLSGPRFCYGATKAGQQYGMLRVTVQNTRLFETPVYFAETAQEVRAESIWAKLINFIFRRTP